MSENPSDPSFCHPRTGIPFSRQIARASSAYRSVVFSMAFSISTASRRKTPPWRSSPRWILGIFFQVSGRLSVRLGSTAAMETAVNTAMSVVLHRMLFHISLESLLSS